MGVWDERHVEILDWANRVNALRPRPRLDLLELDVAARLAASAQPGGPRDQLVSNPGMASVKRSKRPPPSAAPPAEWSTAFDKLYSAERLKRFTRIRLGDPAGIEDALVFLEADPWCFRSGYIKQDLVRYLRRANLDESQKDRLRDALIIAVKAGSRSEFREYCRTARTVDSPRFRIVLQILSRSRGRGSGVQTRARWMLDALERPPGP